MSQDDKIAVTAASGQLGSAIVRATLEIVGEEKIVGLARTPSKAQSLDVEIRPGGYTKPAELTKSLRGVEKMVLVSGMAAPQARIGQHRNVIQAAKDAGVSKIVYTSIQGADEGTAFSPVVQSNRQTERDIQHSGLQWVIGRNGLYVEPDIEYIDTYRQRGEIANCAGDGKCGYTTRKELAFAYARMLTETKHDGNTYNLHGKTLTQRRLADHLNDAFGTSLVYREVSVTDYRDDRIAELGEFLGSIIAGIYEGVRYGAMDNKSDFAQVAGRNHESWQSYFRRLNTTE